MCVTSELKIGWPQDTRTKAVVEYMILVLKRESSIQELLSFFI